MFSRSRQKITFDDRNERHIPVFAVKQRVSVADNLGAFGMEPCFDLCPLCRFYLVDYYGNGWLFEDDVTAPVFQLFFRIGVSRIKERVFTVFSGSEFEYFPADALIERLPESFSGYLLFTVDKNEVVTDARSLGSIVLLRVEKLSSYAAGPWSEI